MSNNTIYPYGTNGELPSSIGLVNDLRTGGVNKALTAEQGKIIGSYLAQDNTYTLDSTVMFSNLSTISNKYISAATKEWGSANWANCYLVPVPSGVNAFKFSVHTRISSYAFLTTDQIVIGQVADFVSGYDQLYDSESEVIIDIPVGCSYIYVFKSGSFDIASISFYNVQYSYLPAASLQDVENVKHDTHTKYIAPYNATTSDKKKADYVCTGTNDVDVINNAIASLNGYGTIVLFGGTFIVDKFTQIGDRYIAIPIPNTRKTNYQEAENNYSRYVIKAFHESSNRVVFSLSNSVYESLDDDVEYSIFGTNASINNKYAVIEHYVFEDIMVELYGNKKPVICFDGREMGAMRCIRCIATCNVSNLVGQTNSEKYCGVIGCIGFRGTFGSNNALDSIWDNCMGRYMGQAFAVSGEHLILVNCAAVYSLYGYTFNYYETVTGGLQHGITLIGCCDEGNKNLPYFVHSKNKQPINIYNLSIELYDSLFSQSLGSEYAKIASGCSVSGHVDYHIQLIGTFSTNNCTTKFWEDGNGDTFESINNAQLKRASLTTIKTYAPNYNQIIYCIDLNMPLICSNPSSKEWRDFSGTIR